MNVTIHPVCTPASQYVTFETEDTAAVVRIVKVQRTSDGDLYTDIHQDEEGEQMQCLEPKNLAVLAIFAGPRLSTRVTDLGHAFYV